MRCRAVAPKSKWLERKWTINFIRMSHGAAWQSCKTVIYLQCDLIDLQSRRGPCSQWHFTAATCLPHSSLSLTPSIVSSFFFSFVLIIDTTNLDTTRHHIFAIWNRHKLTPTIPSWKFYNASDSYRSRPFDVVIYQFEIDDYNFEKKNRKKSDEIQFSKRGHPYPRFLHTFREFLEWLHFEVLQFPYVVQWIRLNPC